MKELECHEFDFSKLSQHRKVHTTFKRFLVRFIEFEDGAVEDNESKGLWAYGSLGCEIHWKYTNSTTMYSYSWGRSAMKIEDSSTRS
jgi:hypothetical protein